MHTNRSSQEHCLASHTYVPPVVLTATIIPNAVKTPDADWRVRRQQYLYAIAFYARFSRVYFIENSEYDLAGDTAFMRNDKCVVLKYPPSEHPERGKGYQEFQMLDKFVRSALAEDDFVKITGRYIYTNFSDLYAWVRARRYQYDVVIDRFVAQRLAITGLFYVTKSAYRDYFEGHYKDMNDPRGVWAEHVINATLKGADRVVFFHKTPCLAVGDRCLDASILKTRLKDLQRAMLSRIGARKLLR